MWEKQDINQKNKQEFKASKTITKSTFEILNPNVGINPAGTVFNTATARIQQPDAHCMFIVDADLLKQRCSMHRFK